MPAPPADWLSEADLEAANHALPSSFSLGSYTVTLERTTLGEIAERAGGDMGRIEDKDGRSADALCYTLPKARLWIMSDAETGGPGRVVTEAVMSAAALPPEPGCPALSEKHLAVVFLTGVAIGSSPRAVTDALGEPSHARDGKIGYMSEMRSGTGGECTVTRMTGAAIDDESVSELRLRQITSC